MFYRECDRFKGVPGRGCAGVLPVAVTPPYGGTYAGATEGYTVASRGVTA
ncbi:MAG: hypothetical protein WCB46_09230 [Methanoregula sp.]